MKLKNVLFRLSCLCIAFFCLGSSSAQLEITSVGDDFWFGFMQNESTNVELSVFISSEQIATGVIEMPLTGWSESFVTTPGQTTTILVPLAAMNNTSGQIQDKGIHISSDLPISVYCINYQEFTADGTRIFPKQFLETEYVVSAYSGLSSLPSQLLVVGTEDGTEIVITPSCDMEGGFTTGVPFTIDLNQGDTYQLKASGFNADVSGTTVRSTEASGECRPFAVFGGAQCANIPNNCSACDHLFDQAIPTNVWGTQYYTVPLEGATSYTYRVTASEDNTDVMIDSVFAFTLNANEYEEVNFEEDPLYITGSTPILVAQYMEGSTCAGFGDPAFMTLNSANQTMDNVTFATVVSTIITDHNLNVVVASTAINEVFLDGTLVMLNFRLPKGVTTYNVPRGLQHMYMERDKMRAMPTPWVPIPWRTWSRLSMYPALMVK